MTLIALCVPSFISIFSYAQKPLIKEWQLHESHLTGLRSQWIMRCCRNKSKQCRREKAILQQEKGVANKTVIATTAHSPSDQVNTEALKVMLLYQFIKIHSGGS